MTIQPYTSVESGGAIMSQTAVLKKIRLRLGILDIPSIIVPSRQPAGALFISGRCGGLGGQ